MEFTTVLADVTRIFAPFIAVGLVAFVVYCFYPKFPHIFFPELGSEDGEAE